MARASRHKMEAAHLLIPSNGPRFVRKETPWRLTVNTSASTSNCARVARICGGAGTILGIAGHTREGRTFHEERTSCWTASSFLQSAADGGWVTRQYGVTVEIKA